MPRLDWMGELPDDAREQVVRQAFQRVAATEDGAIVFTAIFHQLCFFQQAASPEQQALSNGAKLLLNFFGDDITYRIMDAITGGQKRVSKQG